jgi:anaerobic selenocysteine-containing dehydrogenase
MTEPASRRIVQSNCHYCGYLCGFLVTVEAREDGERLVDLRPDPTRYPYSERITNGCPRWRMNLEQIDAPERVNYPLRRVGERGSGQWEVVSWEEALDDIADRLRTLAATHGPETLASAIGGPHAPYWPLHRFMNLFGSPNNMGIGQICWNARIWMDCLSYGWPIEVNIDPSLSRAVFLWGTNPADSDNSLFWRTLSTMDQKQTPLVVVDPRRTRTARRATLHLAPRPGTDCTLALALIREIIATGRHDMDFIQRWCHGFEELVRHVEPYTLEHAEQVCGIAAADVARAAELFSQPGPTALLSGRGIDQLGPNTAPTHRALAALRAITGDVDRPGACLIEGMSDFIPEIDLEMSEQLGPRQRALQLQSASLQSYSGFEGATRLTDQPPFHKRLPMRYLTSAHPHLVWQAMLGRGPYPIRALICMASNPLVTYADTRLVHEALRALDLLVVLEYYLTPTAQLADYVLPSAGAFERPEIQMHGGVANFCYGGAAALLPYYERKRDYDVFRELGMRLGQGEHWPDVSLDRAIERTLAPAGVDWQRWTTQGIYAAAPQWYKHERMVDDKREAHGARHGDGNVELPTEVDGKREAHGARHGDGDVELPTEMDGKREAHGARPLGFATTTGKLEFVCEYLTKLGAERLPSPKPLPTDPAYPLTLLTGARVQPYWASSYFNNPAFRARHPHPTAQMSATTLERVGAREGDWIEVATARGAARFVAEVTEIVDEVISVEYGWWYPEEAQGEPHLSGIWRSNANLLTSADPEDCEPLLGSWSYNAIPCAVRLVPSGRTPS